MRGQGLDGPYPPQSNLAAVIDVVDAPEPQQKYVARLPIDANGAHHVVARGRCARGRQSKTVMSLQLSPTDADEERNGSVVTIA
jgi:hypothetical protein